MVEDEEIEDFLEHFGVKGMKWGVRKKRDEKARAEQFGKKGSGKKAPPRTLTRYEKPGMSGKKKAAIAAGLIGAGALVAAAVIANNNNVSVKQLGGMQEAKASIQRSADAFKSYAGRVGPRSPRPSVARIGGAIPMPAAGKTTLRTTGKTLIRDLPQGVKTKVSDLPPDLRQRAQAAVRAARATSGAI